MISALGSKPEQNKTILPMSVNAARTILTSLAESVPLKIREGCVDGSLGVIAALNFYACAGFSSKPIETLPARSLPEAAITSCRHVFSRVAIVCQQPPVAFDLAHEIRGLRDRNGTYAGDSVSCRRQLQAHLVEPAWPKPGEAAVCNLAD